MHTTNVANGGPYPIWVMVDCDKSLIREMTSSFQSANVGGEVDARKVAYTCGFTKINPGNFLPFNPDVTGSQTVYISIFWQSGGVYGMYGQSPSKFGVICSCYPRGFDQSVVVGSDNQLHAVKNGGIWVDARGKNHFENPKQ